MPASVWRRAVVERDRLRTDRLPEFDRGASSAGRDDLVDALVDGDGTGIGFERETTAHSALVRSNAGAGDGVADGSGRIGARDRSFHTWITAAGADRAGAAKRARILDDVISYLKMEEGLRSAS